jgi:hypothetical protein
VSTRFASSAIQGAGDGMCVMAACTALVGQCSHNFCCRCCHWCIYCRGGMWNAEYEGKRVVRYVETADSSSWEVSHILNLPASQATCPCIGGPEGNLLFVTTACNWYSDARKEEEPLAGSLLIYRLPDTLEFKSTETLFAD